MTFRVAECDLKLKYNLPCLYLRSSRNIQVSLRLWAFKLSSGVIERLCIKMKGFEGNLDTVNPPNLQVIFPVQVATYCFAHPKIKHLIVSDIRYTVCFSESNLLA